MKTKFWFLLILLLLLVALVSCDPSDAGETTPVAETTTVAETSGCVTSPFGSLEEYIEYVESQLDRDVSHKPTREDAMKVTEGMPIAEVLELLGKPHVSGLNSMVPSLLWYLEDGGEIFMCFMVPADCWDARFELYWEYGIAMTPGISDPK